MQKFVSLLEFLSGPGVGGIRIFRNQMDTVGAADLRAMDADKWHLAKPFRAKLLRLDSGLCPDDAALAAWQAGYFGDASDRPDLNTFLEAVREELGGNMRYTTDDAAAMFDGEIDEFLNDSRGAFYGDGLEVPDHFNIDDAGYFAALLNPEAEKMTDSYVPPDPVAPVEGRVIPANATVQHGPGGVVYLYGVPFETRKGRRGVTLYAKGFRPGMRKHEMHKVFNEDAAARDVAVAAFLRGELVQ